MEPNANAHHAHGHTREGTGPSSRGDGGFCSGGGGEGFRIYDEYKGPNSRRGKRPIYGDGDTSMRTKMSRTTVNESMSDVIDLDPLIPVPPALMIPALVSKTWMNA